MAENSKTKKVDFSEDYFGMNLKDPYVWLENAKEPEVLEWVKKQNKVTDEYFKRLQNENINEFANKLKEKAKNIRYLSEYEMGDRIFAGKVDEQGERSVVILDMEYNEIELIADAKTFENKFVIFNVVPSIKDNGICLIEAMPHGAARPSFIIYNYKTKELINQINDAFSAVWSSDGEKVYYADTKVNNEKKTNISYIRMYNYITHENETIFVYDKPATFTVLKTALKSEYIFAEVCTDYSNNELFVINDKEKQVKSLSKGLEGSFKYIGTTNGKHYVLTSLNAPNSKIIAIEIESGLCENAITVVSESEGIIEGATVAEGKIVAIYMKDVNSIVSVFDYRGVFIKNLSLPSEMGSAGGMGFDYQMASEEGCIYFNFESYTNPLSTLKYNIIKDELKTVYVLENSKVSKDVVVSQKFITVRDGTKVPAYIVHRKDIVLDGNNPTIMHGYGGYNFAIPPTFQSFIGINIHEWVEAGYVYVNCNIRGGNEYGTMWHKAGNLMNKKNVFFDFIDITEWLIKNKWTNPEKIAICGLSNGGLLMTALLTMRPDLWKAVIASVPHTDMIRFKNDDRGTMYTTEYGNPEDEEMFKYLLSYSPYHNIKNVVYPAVYLQTGENDNNVPPYHSKKFTARIQELNKGENPTLLRVLKEGSHDRGKGDDMYKTLAEMQIFISNALNTKLP